MMSIKSGVRQGMPGPLFRQDQLAQPCGLQAVKRPFVPDQDVVLSLQQVCTFHYAFGGFCALCTFCAFGRCRQGRARRAVTDRSRWRLGHVNAGPDGPR